MFPCGLQTPAEKGQFLSFYALVFSEVCGYEKLVKWNLLILEAAKWT